MTTGMRGSQGGGAATQGARLCPPRTSRSGPERPEAPAEFKGVPCGQPAAAGAPRTQPRSGRNPRGARGFCRVVVQSGEAATDRVWNAIPAPEVFLGQCAASRFPSRRDAGGVSPGASPRQRTPPPEIVPRGSVPQRGIEEMVRDAGRSLADRRARGDERWWRRCGLVARKTSSMPRWGMARLAWQPGAAPAGADLPPANFPRRPSGTKSQASATILRWSDGGQQHGKILAAREDFSRSAAVCAEHQPQLVGPTGRLGFQRVFVGIPGRSGWSSADTAALR